MMRITAILLVLFTTCIDWMQCQSQGSVCYKDGVQGVCMKLRRCSQAIYELKAGLELQYCPSGKKSSTVCCVQSSNITNRFDVNTCPPIRSDAVKVQKTGRKAWDKCIEWVDYVMPCIRENAFLLDARLVRTDRCGHSVAPLVYGGTLAERNEFPHMALLGFENEVTKEVMWSCAGILISKRWVITAAHCLYSINTNSEVKYVRLGSPNRDDDIDHNMLFTVNKLVPHPQYDVRFKYNDIALLKLDRKATLSPNVLPACLHIGNHVQDDKMLASGWGKTEKSNDNSNSLLKVTLEKFSYSECIRKYSANRLIPSGVLNTTQLCAGHHTQVKDICTGDSGGPLQIYNTDVYCMYTIIGITSFGVTCGVPGTPNIYTRIAPYVPWIEENVWP